MENFIEIKENGCGDIAADEMTQDFLAILADMTNEEKLELLEYVKSII